MAIYHFHFKSVQRSKGMSSIPYAAYIRGVSMTDERTGLSYNFSCKDDIAHTNIMIPENSPQWIKELLHLDVPEGLDEFSKRTLLQDHENKVSSKLWNMSEQHSLKCNARTANIIDLALPCELTLEENVELLEDFIKNTYTRKGMIADYSIHYDGQNKNPHGHIILSNRELSENGFGKVNEYWNTNAFLCKQRKDWADFANLHLFTRGHNVEIDHRSYKDQGIDLEPTVHVGTGKYHDVKDRLSENNEIKQRNALKILENPSIVFDALAKIKQTFTHDDIANVALRYAENSKQFDELMVAMKQSEHLLEVGSKEGHKVYAPRSVLVAQQPNEHEDIKTTRDSIINAHTLANFDKVAVSENDPSALSQEAKLRTIADKIIRNIETHNSLFNDIDIGKALAQEQNLTNQDMLTIATMVKTSSEAIHLGPWIDGRETYTTKRLFNIESEIQELVDTLHAQQHLKLSNAQREKLLIEYQTALPKGKQLTEEQFDAVRYAIDQKHSIANIEGRSGTGKSYSLKAVQAVFERTGVNVYGVALQGVAASNLSKGGINARTIDSFKWSLENHKLDLKKGDVLFIDEAGMVDSANMHFILKAAVQHQLKLIPVGDPRQIDPVGAGVTFEWMMQRVGRKALTTVYRQTLDWQKTATVALSTFAMQEGIKAYHDRGYINYVQSREEGLESLVKDMINHKTVCGQSISNYLVLAYTNAEVNDLNEAIRSYRVQLGEIAEGYEVDVKSSLLGTGSKTLRIATDDRIIFLENDKRLGVSNGSFGTIEHVEFMESGKVINFKVKLDGEDGKVVTIDPAKYKKFDLGYAATVHKAQGLTQGFVYGFDNKSGWLRNLFYVAATRHKNMFKFFTTQKDFDSLSHSMERMSLKDSTLSFPWMFAQVRGFDPENINERFIKSMADRLKQLKDRVIERYEQIFVPERYAQRIKTREDKIAKQTEYTKSIKEREDARLVAQYVDTNRACGASWELVRLKMEDYGAEALNYNAPEFKLIACSEEYKKMEQLGAERDRLAYQILLDKAKYSKALEVHRISDNKLQNQSQLHEKRELVKSYIQAVNDGRIVHRDLIADQINQDIKGYFVQLKAQNVDFKTLYQHANAHRDRKFMLGLSDAERVGFKWVREYTSLNKKVYEIMKALPDSRASETLTEIGTYPVNLKILQDQRNEVAQKILVNAELCDRSLAYFNIGGSAEKADTAKRLTQMHVQQNASPRIIAILDSEEIDLGLEKKEQMRWYRLQQQASAHIIKERVQSYLTAVGTRDSLSQQRLAATIVSESQLHHGAVISEDASWQEIRKDARDYEFEQRIAVLSPEQHKAYREVKNYLNARADYGRAWGEVLDHKANAKGELPSVGYKKIRLFQAHAENVSPGTGIWVQEQNVAALMAKESLGQVFYIDVMEDSLTRQFKSTINSNGTNEYIADSVHAQALALSRKPVPEINATTIQFDEQTFNRKMLPLMQPYEMKRGELAFQLHKNIELYTPALNEFKVKVEDVQRQAENYLRRKRVMHYVEELKAGRMVHRDRLAAEIHADMKKHFFVIKSYDLDTKQINRYAEAHRQRALMATLSIEEREGFRLVHEYKKFGRTIYQKMKELPEVRKMDDTQEVGRYHMAEELKLMVAERNRMAYDIMERQADCEAGLDYFNIGGSPGKNDLAKRLTEQHFNQTANARTYAIASTEEVQQGIEKTEQMRWYRLQQQATLHIVSERVKEYQAAVQAKNIELQGALALQIIKEASLHNWAVIRQEKAALGSNLWQQITRDAKRYEFENKIASLSIEEQSAYRLVRDYVDARRECGKAWGEVFETKALQIGELPAVGFNQVRLYRAEGPQEVSNWNLSVGTVAKVAQQLEGQIYYLDVSKYDLMRHFKAISDVPGEYVSDSIKSKSLLLARKEVPGDTDKVLMAKEFNEKEFFNHVNPSLKTLSAQRDAIANQILKNPDHFKNALAEFNINLDKIKQQSDAHERHLLVERYSKAQGHTEKGILAQQICEASELFYREVNSQNIDWKEIRFNKRIQDNKVLFNEAEGIEKRLIRDIHTYKELNKQAGKAWSKVFSLKEAQLPVSESLNQKASLLSAKRDIYATKVFEKYDLWEVQKDWGEISSTKRVSEYIKGSIDLEKLSLRAEKHKAKMSHAMQYVEHRELFIESLKEVMQGNKPNAKFLHMQDEFADLLKPFKKGAYSYLPSLNQLGLNVETIRKDSELIKDYEKYQEKVYESEHMQGHQPELDMERINKARKLAEQSVTIEGTLAERYLREHRGIKGEIPNSYRYLERTYHFATEKYYPALMVLATDNKGEVYAVQRIFLDPVTANKSSDLGKMAKLTNGQMIEGVGVLVSEGQSKDRIAIAEGPETAISIKEADPTLRVYAALGSGNFRKMPYEDAKEVIICADNDGIGAASDKKVVEAAARYSDQGIKVYQIIPESMDGHKKTDFNDVLKAHGAGKVKEYLTQPQMIIDAVTEKSLKAKLEKSLEIKQNSADHEQGKGRKTRTKSLLGRDLSKDGGRSY